MPPILVNPNRSTDLGEPDQGATAGGFLAFGEQKHVDLLRHLTSLADASHTEMQRNYEQWMAAKETLKPVTKSKTTHRQNAPKEQKATDLQLAPTSGEDEVRLPLAYSLLETLLTYMVTAFLETPPFEYEGVGPEDTDNAILLTALIHYHLRKGNISLAMHTLWRDAFVYGVGFAMPTWETRRGTKLIEAKKEVFDAELGDFIHVPDPKGKKVRQIVYQGNSLLNIDPLTALPDPGVPIHEAGQGMYFGWLDTISLLELKTRIKESEEEYINIHRLNTLSGTRSKYNAQQDAPEHKNPTKDSMRSIDLLNMYAWIAPADYDLGEEELPELWHFVIAEDTVIIQARQANLDHNQIPVVAYVPDFDGHTSNLDGRVSVVEPLHAMMNDMFTNRMDTLRKGLGDRLIVDPTAVNIYDLLTPGPAKLVRLRRAAWGQPEVARGAITQLPFVDHTNNILAEFDYLQNMSKEISGATDAAKGIVSNTGPRISSAAAQQAFASSISRLQRLARIFALQVLVKLGEFFAYHAQQFLQEESWIKVVGSLAENLQTNAMSPGEQQRMTNLGPQGLKTIDRLDGSRATFVKIGRAQIDLVFDVTVRPSIVPGSENLETLTEIFKIVASNPLLSTRLSLVDIFLHLARLSGVKNIDEFVLPAGNALSFNASPSGSVPSQPGMGGPPPSSTGTPGIPV